MFSFIRPVFDRNNSHPIDRLAREVAEQSAPDARQRLRRDVSAMSAAELRGYIRARAARPVRQHAQQIIPGHGRQLVSADELAARALERTVNIVVRQLALLPAGAAKSGAGQRRQAA